MTKLYAHLHWVLSQIQQRAKDGAPADNGGNRRNDQHAHTCARLLRVRMRRDEPRRALRVHVRRAHLNARLLFL